MPKLYKLPRDFVQMKLPGLPFCAIVKNSPLKFVSVKCKTANVVKRKSIEWKRAPDVKKRIIYLAKTLKLRWIKVSRLYCYRSTNSKSRAQARIWGLSKIWQRVLREKPAYIIEVLSERFDNMSQKEKDRVLIHELAHIPQNFSGSLLPHVRKKGKRNFNDRVSKLVQQCYQGKTENEAES